MSLVYLLSLIKGTSNNYQSVTPAPYQVRGKLRRESSGVKNFWIPAFAGITLLEVALIDCIDSKRAFKQSGLCAEHKGFNKLPQKPKNHNDRNQPEDPDQNDGRPGEEA